MHFKTLRLMLLVPPALPLSILTGAFVAEKLGHGWNVHGDAIAMVGLFAVTSAGGCVIELLALAKALPALVERSAERTLANLACTAIGAAHVILCVAGLILMVRTG